MCNFGTQRGGKHAGGGQAEQGRQEDEAQRVRRQRGRIDRLASQDVADAAAQSNGQTDGRRGADGVPQRYVAPQQKGDD